MTNFELSKKATDSLTPKHHDDVSPDGLLLLPHNNVSVVILRF
jgi:hypothetical protein